MNTEFLQSAEWLALQQATGKETVPFEGADFSANAVIHTLPLVGRYMYVPRGPKISIKYQVSSIKDNIEKLVAGAKERKMKWVRIEPETEELLEVIRKAIPQKIVKAPHDMQPREIFKIDISPVEESLLAQMKPKTRYNIRLAEKRGVRVFESRDEKYVQAFLDLITRTSGRKGITAHPKSYYEQFFTVLPETMCRLFVAEYQGVVVAANLVMFYGDTVTYLHGGTADEHRDVMAPYLLQWEQIKAAKARGYRYYDLGGVRTSSSQQTTVNKPRRLEKKSDWEGITRFKKGFSPSTVPKIFPGSYDIILDPVGYFLYDALRFVQQQVRRIFH